MLGDSEWLYHGIKDGPSSEITMMVMAATVVTGGLIIGKMAAGALLVRRAGLSSSIVMESSSSKSAHRPYREDDIPKVLAKAISDGIIGTEKEVFHAPLSHYSFVLTTATKNAHTQPALPASCD